ncbi:MAG: M28 family peptidase [Chitinophagaceae bacterium]
MYKYLLLLLIVPQILLSQSKRKLKKIKALQLIEKAKQNDSIVKNLQTHVTFLADDKLLGRRTGTEGEKLAMEYLVKQYESIGLLKTSNSYTQSFEVNDGKNYRNANTYLKIDDINIDQKNFFPLHFSANKSIKNLVSVSLRESNSIWIIDIKEAAEENKTNPHFDVLNYLLNQSTKYEKNGANGIIFINSSSNQIEIPFDKKTNIKSLNIPVIYLEKNVALNFVKDVTASFKIEFSVELFDEKRIAKNIIGFIDNNATNTIILGAHYDHLGFGEDKNALDTAFEIHNGADDNASGSAALIELARLIKNKQNKNYNYLFIHFSGEELGLLGSKFWLDNPTIKIHPNCMINMDMIGRYDTTHKLTIGGYGTSPTWSTILPNITTSLITKFDSTGGGPSDHASFYRKDIPVLFFFTGSHSDYHKTTDDASKINYTDEALIVQYILEVIDSLNTKPKLSFLKTAEPKMGKSNKFSVSLGVIPDYGFNGTGVRIDGVSPNKLAEKIGLQAGDILLQLGEHTFTDVMSYMTSLSKFKKGDATTLKVKRGNNELSFDIIF